MECTPRDGWPNFFAKAAKGGEFKVAYLGGSITAQPGWRVKSLAWLNAKYPKSKFSEINAAIGGTGSDLGVLRIEHDVLNAKPDLLFVEFAVNDGGAAPEEIIKSMEGIVRKTWKTLPACDICFVYTFTTAYLAELKTGKFNRSAATMEVVADNYGIPTIHMGLEAVRLESEGKLLMQAPEAKVENVAGDVLNVEAKIAVNADGKIPFSKDGVHPYTDTGHQLYMNAIARSIPAILKAGGTAIITADHGNADEMYELDKKGAVKRDKEGHAKAKTSHTLNPVPFILVTADANPGWKLAEVPGAGLANIAATLCNLLGYEAPSDYEPSLVVPA